MKEHATVDRVTFDSPHKLLSHLTYIATLRDAELFVDYRVCEECGTKVQLSPPRSSFVLDWA